MVAAENKNTFGVVGKHGWFRAKMNQAHSRYCVATMYAPCPSVCLLVHTHRCISTTKKTGIVVMVPPPTITVNTSYEILLHSDGNCQPGINTGKNIAEDICWESEGRLQGQGERQTKNSSGLRTALVV